MKLKEIDFKQFLLEKGERVGLGLAVGLMVLMVLTSLFLPGSGLFSGSPVEKAKALEGTTQQVQSRLQSAQPDAADLPPADAKEKLKAFDVTALAEAPYEVAGLFDGGAAREVGRRPPEVFPVDEAHVAVAHVQVRSYIIKPGRNGESSLVYVLEDAPGSAGSTQALQSLGKTFGPRGGRNMDMGGMPGRPMPSGSGGGSGAGSGGGSGMRGPGRPGGAAGMMAAPGLSGTDPDAGPKRDYKVRPVELDKIQDQQNVKLAEQVRPMRMAIIAGSFPYKAELEEFRDKLHLNSIGEVLQEYSKELGPDGQPLPGFRFLRVDVERRTLGADGKPGAWQALNLTDAYRPYIVLTGRRFEPESPRYASITFPGLVMPRLLQFQEQDVVAAEESATPSKTDQYPHVEDQVANLTKTLEELKDKEVSQIVKPPSPFSADNFDPFNAAPAPAAGAGMAPGMGAVESGMGPRGMPPGMAPRPGGSGMAPGSGGMMAPRPGMPAPGMAPRPGGSGMGSGSGGMGARPGMPGAGMPGAPGMPGQPMTGEETVPDHCLVRWVDVTIEPGKTYQYRLQVRMANPNFQRTDVASPTYAQEKELQSDKWYEVPDMVKVPPELLYYAVDQKELEGRDYRGIYARVNLDRDRQTALQIFRWLETASNRNNRNEPLIVGEWVAAERVPVYRGEYAGRDVRVEIPVWRYRSEQFVIASDSTTKRNNPGIEVPFGYDRPDGQEPVLVDFGGGRQGYDKIVRQGEDMDKPQTRRIEDTATNEVLLLTPDGKLRAHLSAVDADNAERKDLLKQVRERIAEVRKGGKPGGPATTPGGGGANPFRD